LKPRRESIASNAIFQPINARVMSMQLPSFLCSTVLLILCGCTHPWDYAEFSYVRPYSYGQFLTFGYPARLKTGLPPYRRTYLRGYPFERGPLQRHGIRLHYRNVLRPGADSDGVLKHYGGSQRLREHRRSASDHQNFHRGVFPSLQDRHLNGRRPFRPDRRFGHSHR
jgi:hypothetical protein